MGLLAFLLMTFVKLQMVPTCPSSNAFFSEWFSFLVGDAVLSRPWAGTESALAEIAHFYHSICSRGILPLSAGGDHSVTLPILRAVSENLGGPVGLVHLDAHMDTSNLDESEKSMGSKVRHPFFSLI